MTNFLLTKPEVLFGKAKKGGKIGVNSRFRHVIMIPKRTVSELPYDYIDD